MAHFAIGDWVAMYAASLSTLLAIAGFLKWVLTGPKLTISVFNPNETSYNNRRTFIAIASNTGSMSTVVREIAISFRTSRWPWSKEIAAARFNEASHWNPSVRFIPDPHKPNNSFPEPNILAPGSELRAPARASEEYAPERHWIRVTAFVRNKQRGFVGWAAPKMKPAPKVDDK